MPKTGTTGVIWLPPARTIRIDPQTSLGWVEKEDLRRKTQKRRPLPPPSKSTIRNGYLDLTSEMCKKQQDLQLSMKLTRIFVFYIPPPPPNVENEDPPPPQNHLDTFAPYAYSCRICPLEFFIACC